MIDYIVRVALPEVTIFIRRQITCNLDDTVGRFQTDQTKINFS